MADGRTFKHIIYRDKCILQTDLETDVNSGSILIGLILNQDKMGSIYDFTINQSKANSHPTMIEAEDYFTSAVLNFPNIISILSYVLCIKKNYFVLKNSKSHKKQYIHERKKRYHKTLDRNFFYKTIKKVCTQRTIIVRLLRYAVHTLDKKLLIGILSKIILSSSVKNIKSDIYEDDLPGHSRTILIYEDDLSGHSALGYSITIRGNGNVDDYTVIINTVKYEPDDYKTEIIELALSILNNEKNTIPPKILSQKDKTILNDIIDLLNIEW